jgi:hypothetical protein
MTGDFAVQPFNIGDNKVFSRPSAVGVLDENTRMSAKFPFASLRSPFCCQSKRQFCPVAEIAPGAVKDVFSLVFDCNFTASAPFSASSFVGERESIIACNSVAMPVTNGGLQDVRPSPNLCDGSALQIWHTEAVEDIIDVDMSMDVMLAFHDLPEGRDHREAEIVNDQYREPRI